MTKVSKIHRKKMVLAMEFIMRHLNDERDILWWLEVGVADGDISINNLSNPDEVDDYYIEDETFAQLMGDFVNILYEPLKSRSGKLYCDRVCSN